MLSEKQYWEILEPVVNNAGFRLFDIDLPRRNGTLRVYIDVHPQSDQEAIGMEDCVEVHKQILALVEYDELVPEQASLEVSSPGINRRLRRREHFCDAVGERLKVRFQREGEKATTLRGMLHEFTDDVLSLEEESQHEKVSIQLSEIKDAQVDFIF